MRNTTIEWTDKSWNPTRGRGPAAFDGFAKITNGRPSWTGKVELIESKLQEPLHWKKPCRIFVNSMSDLFHEALSDDDIDHVFGVISLSPRHTFQILTKRPGRMLKWAIRKFIAGDVQIRANDLRDRFRLPLPCVLQNRSDSDLQVMAEMTDTDTWPLPNVWLGVSVENRPTWDERVPLLKVTPAAKRFVSYEPALDDLGAVDLNGLDQVIVGGESGPGARPFNIAWAENTIRQCKTAGVACFVKQLGARPYLEREAAGAFVPDYEYSLKDRKGGGMSEWPTDLRVREFPA